MARLAALMLSLAACGRVNFDELSSVDGGLPARIPWGAPEAWSITPTGDDPSMTADLLELYVNRSSADLFRTTRPTLADAWTPSAIVPELDVTDPQSTSEVTPDGLTMYFSSARPGSLGNNDIWMTTRSLRSDPWGTPVLVPELSTTLTEHPGNMTADRLTIVLDSRRQGTADDDLYIATRATTSDAWGGPTAIAELNVAGVEDESPNISSDGLELYFDSNRTGTNELYVARRLRVTDPFGPPEQLLELVQPGGEFDPWVSPDGHDLLFYSSGIWHATR